MTKSKQAPDIFTFTQRLTVVWYINNRCYHVYEHRAAE